MRLVWLVGLVSMWGCGAASSRPLPVGPTEAQLSLNDVSFLLPLPESGREVSLPSVFAPGLGGPLLPRALADALPSLVEGQRSDEVVSELRVVSIRVDPCFPSAAVEPRCLSQVRLVAQPVTVGDGGVTTRDATVHLFYTLDQAAFSQVTDRLFLLDERAGAQTDGPLGVHPVISAQGLEGPYFGRLWEVVLATCGAGTLSRVAVMTVDAAGRTWQFAAFNVVEGRLEDDTIPRLPLLKVQAFQEFGSESFRNGALVPGAPNDRLDTLLSERDMRLADPTTLRRAMSSALLVENPHRSSPKTVDCASCHVASRARSNAEAFHRNIPDLPERFVSSFDLRRLDQVGDDPRALRAFGYFGARSAFSQRTINESAVVAESLERLRPR